MLTPEDWESWLSHPGTVALRDWAEGLREEYRDRWESGSFIGESEHQGRANQDFALGACNVLRAVQELDYANIVEGDSGEQRTNG